MISALIHRIIMGTEEVTVYSKGGRTLWVEGDAAHNYDDLPFQLHGRDHAQIGDTKYKCIVSDVCDLVNAADVPATGEGSIACKVVTFEDGTRAIINHSMVLDCISPYGEWWLQHKDGIGLPKDEYARASPGLHMRVLVRADGGIECVETPSRITEVRHDTLTTITYPHQRDAPKPTCPPLGFFGNDDLQPIG